MKRGRKETGRGQPVAVPQTLGRTVTHEAGHAAMALILGSRLHSVTVEARRGRPPHALTEDRSPSTCVLVALAGGVAEAIRYRRQMTAHDGDLRQALQVVDMRGVRRFAVIASALLRAHWPGVLALASALKERKTLRGKEAWQVFADGLVPPKPKRRRGKRR